MSVAIDLQRRVRARLPAEHPEGEATEPGEMVYREIEGVSAGWDYCCPGCGLTSYLPRSGIGGETQGWTVVSGDPRDPSTLTLVPSLWHQGPECGWHGYLRNGELAPC